MLTVKTLKPNVYELTLQGVLEKRDIQTMARELTPVLQGDGPLGLIIRAEHWQDMTADALAEDMKFEFGMLTQWANIARMAVVTDLQAVSALLRWIDPILPMIEMRSFPSSDVAAAEAYASDLPDHRDAAPGGGLTLLADGSDGVVAFEVDGRITPKDVEALFAQLQTVMEGDAKVNLLARFKRWDGFDPALLTDAGLFGSKFAMIGHLKRYAVVGAPSWMQGVISAMGAAMPFEMRCFDAADEDAARDWVGWT
ncbi:STAS/SEC14 domain-containing protein [Paracoccus jeotgali]|uniref:STAS/SEC14 domain-containing protein n=1 Tax=Paracoccus jeotgali TaxID=2065379 RepID=UPI0028ACE9C3|nr:STAS/SEC14 domain-containing protein [Paracoccus jeotgali]